MADKQRGSRSALIIVLTISVFFVGLIIGMLLVHVSQKEKEMQEVSAGKSEPATTIQVSGGTEYVKIYVPKREVRYGTIPIHSWNKDGFRLDNGFMAYFDEEGNKISHLGVDISYHQEKIDWEALKESPCEFVMLRCGYRGYTEGGLVEDEKFREYAQAAVDAGFPIGVYFFTQAITEEEAVAEADFVLELIKDFPISYPVVIDTEYVSSEGARTNQAEMTEEERTQLLITFCERVKEYGYYPMIYASENWLRRELEVSQLQPYEIWAPQYLEENDFMYDFTIWQYTDAGHIQGIEGVVDLDISMVDYAAFVPAMREAVVGEGEIIEVTDDTGSTNDMGDHETGAKPDTE
ncbi:MAG: glycoside hydrolase family 25 protein [Lachnospiraceae bacterium]|nr:glycoside hydrolase family 25 protein [Lachnospiraceae bacterium]